ncbi:hypothetical protein B0H13DRAFT_2368339 [Mycena leptocephala]|nr:hypothetical protein B0H13DRAFT_2368339 [Mycena leptocephala]
MAGASRTELLRWLNELLQLNYTNSEQCGAGGVLLQILDSIYGDIPWRAPRYRPWAFFILRAHSCVFLGPPSPHVDWIPAFHRVQMFLARVLHGIGRCPSVLPADIFART